MESGFAFRGEIKVEEEQHVKGQVPKRAPPPTGPHRIRAGFGCVGEHVDRGMELLPDRRSPEVHHEAAHIYLLFRIDELSLTLFAWAY